MIAMVVTTSYKYDSNHLHIFLLAELVHSSDIFKMSYLAKSGFSVLLICELCTLGLFRKKCT